MFRDEDDIAAFASVPAVRAPELDDFSRRNATTPSPPSPERR